MAYWDGVDFMATGSMILWSLSLVIEVLFEMWFLCDVGIFRIVSVVAIVV